MLNTSYKMKGYENVEPTKERRERNQAIKRAFRRKRKVRIPTVEDLDQNLSKSRISHLAQRKK